MFAWRALDVNLKPGIGIECVWPRDTGPPEQAARSLLAAPHLGRRQPARSRRPGGAIRRARCRTGRRPAIGGPGDTWGAVGRVRSGPARDSGQAGKRAGLHDAPPGEPAGRPQ